MKVPHVVIMDAGQAYEVLPFVFVLRVISKLFRAAVACVRSGAVSVRKQVKVLCVLVHVLLGIGMTMMFFIQNSGAMCVLFPTYARLSSWRRLSDPKYGCAYLWAALCCGFGSCFGLSGVIFLSLCLV